MRVCGGCGLGRTVNSCSCGKAAYCGPACQKSDWKSHKSVCPPFRVTRLPGKGRGLVASRRLNCGDLILDETPLMVVDNVNSEIAAEKFKTGFDKLDKETQNEVLSYYDPITNQLKLEIQSSISEIEEELNQQHLSNPDKSSLQEISDRLESLSSNFSDEVVEKEVNEEDVSEKALRIFSANSLQVCEVESLHSATEGGLYRNISLLNHGCSPNCVWSWVAGEPRRKQVRAIKTVSKGEELLANYVDTEEFNFGVRQERRAILLDKFGFICQCSECGLAGPRLEKNEETRRRVVVSKAAVRSLMDQHEERSTVAALQQAQQVGSQYRHCVTNLQIYCAGFHSPVLVHCALNIITAVGGDWGEGAGTGVRAAPHAAELVPGGHGGPLPEHHRLPCRSCALQQPGPRILLKAR